MLLQTVNVDCCSIISCEHEKQLVFPLSVSVPGSSVFLVEKVYGDGALGSVYLFLATDEEEGTKAVSKARQT